MSRDNDAQRRPILVLSHPLSETTPAYGGATGLQIERLSAVSSGDTANSLRLTFPNHLGTHVDAPSHFFDGAPTLTDYGPEDWVFRKPVLIDVDVPDGDLVEPAHVEGAVPDGTDLLILRTGHGKRRGDDVYWQAGPGLSADLGRWLRSTFPSVRAVGMDLISVTTRLNRPAGREAHRAFLDPAGEGPPIRLIEDMWLAQSIPPLKRALVVPLGIERADGGPVTVWAFPADGEPNSLNEDMKEIRR